MNKRVLIIDDDPEIGNLIKEILEFDNYNVITALTSEKGLFNARYNTPNVILLDLFLPDMSGFEVFKVLKQDDRTKEIPVIIITGHTDAQTISMARKLGITGVFYKPFNFARLRKKIKVLVEGNTVEKTVCNICGKEMDDNWEFCPFDGWKRKE